MKKKSVIMVALSASILTPALSSRACAGVIVSCPVTFRIGNIVNCGNNAGQLTIDPDGGTGSMVNCAYITNTPQPAACVVKTDGTPVASNVKVDFSTSSVTVKRGVDTFVLDQLRMSYSAAPTPVKTITLTPAQVTGTGVTINIGGRINPTGGHINGQYSGTITVRANTI